ncbi:MAG: SPASM domain-containing protein, partial [Clostridia bacterium]|nr:SPASM domain-containing protein [Clostridia bacterium]
TTVSKTNRMEVLGIIDAVVEAGVNIFAFSRYVPSGGNLDTTMTAQEYRELLALCDKKFKEYEAENCQTYFNKKDHLWTLFAYETGEFRIPDNTKEHIIYGGCNCGNCHLTILPDGTVYACRRVAESKVGNVFEDRLADLWVTNMESYREYDKFSKCSRCKLLAWCRGCPAVAKGTYGNFYAGDPQCWADENGELFQKGE